MRAVASSTRAVGILRSAQTPMTPVVPSKRLTMAQAESAGVEGIGSKVVILSGNRGLGLEVVRSALDKGLSVVATCRSSSDELDALSESVHIMSGLDVTNESAPQDLVAFLKEKGWDTVDAVISISGLFTFDSMTDLQPPKIMKMYEVCAVGPLRILSHLAVEGVLTEGGKIGMITSEGGSIGLRTHMEGGGNYGHHMSKAAQNMMGKILSIDLKPKGIALVNIHPGFIKTSMTESFSELYDKYGAIEAAEAAPGIIEAVQRLKLENTGQFVAPQGTDSLGFGLEGLENPESVGHFGELPW